MEFGTHSDSFRNGGRSTSSETLLQLRESRNNSLTFDSNTFWISLPLPNPNNSSS
jgi:hypothetical protein